MIYPTGVLQGISQREAHEEGSPEEVPQWGSTNVSPRWSPI
jgi:hypothetical protein